MKKAQKKNCLRQENASEKRQKQNQIQTKQGKL